MNKPSIFITGAGSGIGKEIALLFAQKEWFVGLYDIDEASVAALARDIGENHSCFGRLDVREEEDAKRCMEAFAAHTGGRMHVLVNNAGIIQAGAFDRIPGEAHRRVIDVNVWGVLNCTLQALPHLRNTPRAQVINISSASALYGHPALTAYAASKMAVKSITEGLDLAFRKEGIRVNDIMPMWVNAGVAHDASSQWTGVSTKQMRITPQKVAQTVWKATQRNKLHWLLGVDTWTYHLLGKVFPQFMTRFTARFIMPLE